LACERNSEYLPVAADANRNGAAELGLTGETDEEVNEEYSETEGLAATREVIPHG
jgi:hypothetical protein